MKAIEMRETGGPEVLVASERQVPTLSAPTDLLVHLKAAGVNPIDTKIRTRGVFVPEGLPAVLGCDGAGVVEAVGERVSRFKPGDEVWFCHGGLGGPEGNYAEYALVDERIAQPKPSNLDFVHAAATPLSGVAARPCTMSLVNWVILIAGVVGLLVAGYGLVAVVRHALRTRRYGDVAVALLVKDRDAGTSARVALEEALR